MGIDSHRRSLTSRAVANCDLVYRRYPVCGSTSAGGRHEGQTAAPVTNVTSRNSWLVAGVPVEQLADDVDVAVVAGRLLDEVHDHPAEVHDAAAADRPLGRGVQVV